MTDFAEVKGVKINRADIKEQGKNYVVLKNGIKIDIWKPLENNGEEAYIKIDSKTNKTQLGNLLCAGITGSEGNDNIEISNARFMGNINLNGGDDTLVVKDSFTREVNGGAGNDKIVFNNTRTLGHVSGEKIKYDNNSTAHNTVEGKQVSFENGSSNGFNRITAQNVRYKNEFMR